MHFSRWSASLIAATAAAFVCSLAAANPSVRAWREGDHVVTSRRIMFKNGLVQFTAESRPVVDAVAGWLQAAESFDVIIEGHTDAGGSEADNLALSQGRAEEVKRFLVRRGLSSDRLTAVGRGSAAPLVSLEHPDQYRNRRVEFVLVARNRPVAPVVAETTTIAPVQPNRRVDDPSFEPPLVPLFDEPEIRFPLLDDDEAPVARIALLDEESPVLASLSIPLLDDPGEDLLGLPPDEELLVPFAGTIGRPE